MLGYMLYFSIVLGLFVIGDWLGIWTKAKLSSIFVVLISFLLLFLFKIVPADIIDQAGLTAAASWAMVISGTLAGSRSTQSATLRSEARSWA